jgi:hypothetical protein
MKDKLGIMLALLITCSSFAFAADPQVTVTPKWTHLNLDAKECGGFSEDRLVLKVKINKKEIKHEFCSAYGITDAKIIKDSSGVNYLLLKHAQERGTHCTTQYLTVFRIESVLQELTQFPVYEPAGIFANCYYDYKIKKPKDGGLLFVITPRIENAHDARDIKFLPEQKERTISVK